MEGYPGAWPISLAQDKQGFLWIADFDDGLIRYDGHEFRSYRHDRDDPGVNHVQRAVFSQRRRERNSLDSDKRRPEPL